MAPLQKGAEACGGERVAASRALVGDVVLALGDQKHEQLGAAPAPAPESAVGSVHQDALELGRGLLALGLGRLALDVPVDYEAPHVHLLFDAEVQSELGLHVVSPVWSGGGIPFGPPGGGPCKAEGHGWDGQSLRRHRERDVGGARDGVRGLPTGGPKGIESIWVG